jgi:hypothetical protein
MQGMVCALAFAAALAAATAVYADDASYPETTKTARSQAAPFCFRRIRNDR